MGLKQKVQEYSLNHAWFRVIWLWLKAARKAMQAWKKRVSYWVLSHTHMVEKNTILFEVHRGSSYSCNPRAIYEAMLRDTRFRDFRFIWVFSKKEKAAHKFLLENPNTSIIRRNSKAYWNAFAKANYWVENNTTPNHVRPKRNQVYIETWHGVPLKRLGCDRTADSDFRWTPEQLHRNYRAKGKKFDYLLSPSDFYSGAISTAFDLKRTKNEKAIVETGYPRDDILFHFTADDVERIKSELGIPAGKTVVLYCPTFRETKEVQRGGFALQTPLNLLRLFETLGDGYVFLFRAHHMVSKHDQIPEELADRVIDVTEIDDVNDLYIISDMLVTDYSSVSFDYAHLRRPEIFFMYDLAEYENEIRGFYFDVHEMPGPIVKNTDELAAAILDLSKNFRVDEKYEAFLQKFVTFDDGEASKRVLDLFFEQRKKAFYMRDFFEKHPALYAFCRKAVDGFRDFREWIRNRLREVKHTMLAFLRSMGLFQDENYKKLRSYKNKHKGERCFLIGNGPSLKAEDLDLLKGEICFGCNMIHKIFDQTDWRPTYMAVQDTQVLHHLYPRFERDFVYPLFVPRGVYNKMENYPQETIVIQNVQREKYKVRKNILAYCYSSKATVMALMAELAMFMGFHQICLLGVDGTLTLHKTSHFTDHYETDEDVEVIRRRIEKRLHQPGLTVEDTAKYYQDKSIFAYHELEKFSQKHGVKIYNCTRDGALEEFERKSLESVLGLPERERS